MRGEKAGNMKNKYRDIHQFDEGYVVVETFYDFGSGSRNSIRVRPHSSEGFPPNIRVQCSTKMRKDHPVGTLFRLYLYFRQAATRPELSARNSNQYEIVTLEEIELVGKAKKNSQSTDNAEKFEARCSWLLEHPTFLKTDPTGNERPKKATRTISRFVRSPSVAAWVRHNSEGKCELCRRKAPFKDRYGFPFLEVHHVLPLAEGGPDTTDNAVAVCPNCHKELHLSEKAEKRIGKLYRSVDRLYDHRSA